MAARRPYVRPMAGWWRRDPYFGWYMAREATAPFVAAYALVLLSGLACLAAGREAYEGWLAAMRSPVSLALHGIFLAAFLFHTWSWFRIMPKTIPAIVLGGKRLPDAVITAAGLAASLVASLALLALAWKLGA